MILTATGLPSGVTFEHTASHSATVSWTPTEAQIGRYDIFFHATNSLGETEISATRVHVKAVIPANDELTNATVVSNIPFQEKVNIGEATTGAEPMCRPVQRTVWYSFTASENTKLKATTYGRDFNANLAVYAGTTNGEPLVCGEGTVRFNAVAGQTYLIQVGAIVSYFPPTGGKLVFNLKPASDVLNMGFYKARVFYQKIVNPSRELDWRNDEVRRANDEWVLPQTRTIPR